MSDGLLSTGYSPLLSAILSVRGITDAAGAERFISAGPEVLEDPLLLKDMPFAAERIVRAVGRGEHVAVYGDYDVDGITSTCLLTDYLRLRGLECEFYIPDRIEEGYGLNPAAIEALKDKGVTLIITVDCGVSAVEEADYASSVGVDMIITDHHECPEILPAAVAVVDPKRPDCAYPNRTLAGVGVAFKLVSAIEGDHKKMLERYADLVAVGTVADVMPLTGENRFLVKAGLDKINKFPRPGFEALLREAGMAEKKATTTTIGYSIAPRLNAAGRLGKVSVAARLLISEDSRECRNLASELCDLNRTRQAMELEIWQDAMSQMQGQTPSAPIVLASDSWHQGIVGIAASRLAEAYSLPAIMICLDAGKGKGSCRSFGGFNLFEALSACSGYLESFGGHALAAGLNIQADKVDDFRQAMAEYYHEHPPQETAGLTIDLDINDPALLDMDSVESLSLLEPFGSGNPQPVLCIQGAVLESATPIGGGRHLRLKVSYRGRQFDCVYFSMTAGEFDMRPGEMTDVAFSAQINEFRSRRSVQLVVADMRTTDRAAVCRHILGKGGIPPAQKSALLPDRACCVRIWRALESAGGSTAGEAHEVVTSLCEAGGDGLPRAAVCLRVFEELGLLQLSFSGGRLEVSIIPGEGKADLSASRILQRLAGRQ